MQPLTNTLDRRCRRPVRGCLAAICLLVGVAGCDPNIWNLQRPPTTRPAGTMDPSALAAQRQSPAIQGTIGSVAYLQGSRMMRVRGFGLVIGLGDRGSRNVRPSVREQVLRELRRYRSAHPHQTRHMPPPEKQLESLDTAVVEVLGEIPAGAVMGDRFDVFVRADDPDVQSLAGGYLIPCDLRIYQETTPNDGIEGRIHARASGPVFINPFVPMGATPRLTTSSAPGEGTTVNPREGYVIGGGVNTLDRLLSLVTIMESYATVRQIQDSVNRRFPGDPKTADADSPTNVRLRIPPEMRSDKKYFFDLVMHLPMTTSSIAMEARVKALVAEMGRPDAPLDDAGLALEGIGMSAIPSLRPLYTDPRRAVNYFAARTGMRLGDELATEVIVRHALDARSPFRLPAIRELARCRDIGRASDALRMVLAGGDPRLRIAAYESLRQVDPRSMRTVVVGEEQPNYIVDIVPCEGTPLIYARRTQTRRIALIGGDRMVFQPPLLYAQTGQPITISADDRDPTVKVLRKDVGGRTIGPIQAPLAVAPLVLFMGNDLRTSVDGKLEGLGLDYQVVLDVLYRLAEKGAIGADMRWEEPTVEDLLGPLKPMGRPESEL